MPEALSCGTSRGGCFSLKAPPPALTVMLFADTEGGHLGTSSPGSLRPLCAHCPWERDLGSSLLGTVPRALWAPTSPGAPGGGSQGSEEAEGQGMGLCWGTETQGRARHPCPRGPFHLVQRGHQVTRNTDPVPCAPWAGNGQRVLWGLRGRRWGGSPRPHSSDRPSTRPLPRPKSRRSPLDSWCLGGDRF